MRKITLLFFSLIMIIVLTSCKKEPAPIVQNFSAKFIAQCNGIEVEGKAVVNKNNVISITVTTPDSMNGYTYYYKNDSLVIKYGTLRLDTQSNYLPKTSLPSIIYNVFRSIPKENNCYLSNENELYAEYKGNCDIGEFTIITEYSMGTISEIKIAPIDFSIKFKAIEIIS